MDVRVVGGGPGGAYAALLLKRDHPDWTVRVYESSPASTTYGWGVVLPEKVYPVLREADAPTCERIRSVNTGWDPIDTYHRGEVVRCGGHPYTSVMRTDLLEILQDRCGEVGVELCFQTEADPVSLREEADLLVGADGLASDTRAAFDDRFEPTLTRRSDVYAWFGTDRPFEALSHVYEETDDGVWHAAAYPGETSTFIVDTAAATWRAAGVDEAVEADYRARLEAVFEDVLDGHPLRSKEDRWRHFVTVENERWHDDDVVLVGDAAATAHYTIGSGTRMAMQGAIALVEGIRRHPDDLGAALAWYESERRPHVEALQAAAELSVTHFETIDRYVDAPPIQLALLYLTRTGYNSHRTLRERDPAFVEEVDRWFARRAGSPPGPDGRVDRPMAQPLDLPGLRVPSRTVVAPAVAAGSGSGRPGDDGRESFVDLAASGAGLVVAPAAVSSAGRYSAETPGLWADDLVDVWADAVDAAAERGSAAIGVELVHAGRLAARSTAAHGPPAYDLPGQPLSSPERWDCLAPSALAFSPSGPTPRAMADADLDRVREAFAAAAGRAEAAGFEFLSVHAGRGDLLGSFLSPLSNRRDDRYGGSTDARVRFPAEVVSAVREAWPGPLAVTLQVDDRVEGGLGIEEGFAVARELAAAGADILAPVAGGTVPGAEPPADLARARRYAHWVRHEVGVPTLSTVEVTSRDGVDTLVASGRADLCRVFPGEDGTYPL